MKNEPANEKLERFVDRALRDLPPRRAPESLIRNVRAEIERRAALPWWRQSFVHWPLAARVGFILLSAAIVRVAWTAGIWMMAGFDEAALGAVLAEPMTWAGAAMAVLRAVSEVIGILVRNIPPLWLYGSLVVFATSYAALFGLGAAALKAIRSPR